MQVVQISYGEDACCVTHLTLSKHYSEPFIKYDYVVLHLECQRYWDCRL